MSCPLEKYKGALHLPEDFYTQSAFMNIYKQIKHFFYQAPVTHAYILATQKAEIRRITVQSQPRQIVP
jgi:hypothetical protein